MNRGHTLRRNSGTLHTNIPGIGFEGFVPAHYHNNRSEQDKRRMIMRRTIGRRCRMRHVLALQKPSQNYGNSALSTHTPLRPKQSSSIPVDTTSSTEESSPSCHPIYRTRSRCAHRSRSSGSRLWSANDAGQTALILRALRNLGGVIFLPSDTL